MVNNEYQELTASLSKIIENDFIGIVRLLQNCRLVLLHRAETITFCYSETVIRIDTVKAWKILLILDRLHITDPEKRSALESIMAELGLKKAKNV